MGKHGLVGRLAIAIDYGLDGQKLIGLDLGDQTVAGLRQSARETGWEDAGLCTLAGKLHHPTLRVAGCRTPMTDIDDMGFVQVVIVRIEKLAGHGRVIGAPCAASSLPAAGYDPAWHTA